MEARMPQFPDQSTKNRRWPGSSDSGSTEDYKFKKSLFTMCLVAGGERRCSSGLPFPDPRSASFSS